MPAQRGQLPASWTAYERGRADSESSRVQFDETTEEHHHAVSNGSGMQAPSAYDSDGHHVRRRRSSMGLAIDSITHAGGVNSLHK